MKALRKTMKNGSKVIRAGFVPKDKYCSSGAGCDPWKGKMETWKTFVIVDSPGTGYWDFKDDAGLTACKSTALTPVLDIRTIFQNTDENVQPATFQLIS
jgi:hypothetical protein